MPIINPACIDAPCAICAGNALGYCLCFSYTIAIATGGREAILAADFRVQLEHHIGVIRQELAGILAALAEFLITQRKPRAALLHELGGDGEVEHTAFGGNAL